MLKRLICAATSVMMFFSVCASAVGYENIALPYLEDGKVSLIVEVEGEPVLECSESQDMGAYNYAKSRTAQMWKEELLQVQSEVCDDIMEVSQDIEKGFTYTNVFNGFSITANSSDIEKILKVNNVKGIYISEEIPVPEIQLTEADDEVNLGYASNDMGYNGEGQVICVIDNEFDITHDMFKSAPQNPKFSKEDVAEFVKNMSSVNANEYENVYKSEKIPFAYDYIDNDTNTYCENADANHGTHVASIAAGKQGKLSDGTFFNGVAPEAQLILMKIGNGKSFGMDAVIAALDDACILDIDAINMSLGQRYVCENTVFSKAIDVARKNGITVCTAAGNYGKGFEKKTPYTDSPEYFTGGVPGNSPGAFTVASATGTAVSSFSSYCTTGSLELEPDITAPGYKIYAAKKGNEYQNMSGTSMASPYMSGISVLMNQFVGDNVANDFDRTMRIENLLMSTGKILMRSDGVPYSPRVQGAGMADVEAAMKTPVILKGTDNKTKISLYDNLSDSFNIEFTAQNLSNTDVVYDSIELYTITDGYNMDDYTVSDTVFLKHTADLPQTVTVSANSETELSLDVTLDSLQTAELSEIFTNGFYVEGFVSLNDTTKTNPEISIPFMGFYGDWLKADFFDEPRDKDGAVSDLFGLLSIVPNGLMYTGGNIYSKNIYDSDYAVVSPNKDGYMDILGMSVAPKRSLANAYTYVTDKDGKVKSGIWRMANPGRLSVNAYILTDMISGLPDGEYKVIVIGAHIYDSEEEAMQVTELPLYIDTQKPQIKRMKITESDGKKLLHVAAYDNHHLASFIVSGYSGDTAKTAGVAINPKISEAENGITYATVDITGIDADATVLTADFGINSFKMPLCDYDNGIGVMMNSDLSTNISGIFENMTGESINCWAAFGFYNSDNELICADVKEIEIPINESDFCYNLPDTVNSADTVKVFFWTNDMSPLREKAEFST